MIHNKQRGKEHVVEIYNQYVPQQVATYVNTSFSYWKTHSSYKVYREHEGVINNVLLVLGLLITLKVIGSFLKLIFGPAALDDPDEDEMEKTVGAVVDKRGYIKKEYTEFETIPLCVGKGDEEEALVMQSYAKLRTQAGSESVILQELNKKNVDYRINGFTGPFGNGNGNGHKFELSIIDGSTPLRSTLEDPYTSTDTTSTSQSGLSSPMIAKQHDPFTVLMEEKRNKSIVSIQDVSYSGSPISTKSRSTSPEDSFEREERVVDKLLSRLNEGESDRQVERPYTPSKLSMSSSLEYSPSKKLVFKKSTSILTAHPITSVAETSVGSITKEDVYSKEFSSDHSSDILSPSLRKSL
ncbi:CYFA0S06e00694g1_1 [Cyberlindnera fabianii]|uniref:CYFA0S06e00694g1_1 n=1 Tax=Cyberlindnera fabianii TaxID=36022 RepID=A0A061ATV5_CYBFA|nr:CYFA0S06e00694g1_1 [Cyberlindnera fabianii]